MKYFLIGLLLFTNNLSSFCQKEKKPNIIFIMADDLGYGELGCYGQQKIKTPAIDQMASDGMRFLNYYSSTPVCAPARCQLLTGKHSGHSYIRGNYELGEYDDDHEGGQMPLYPKALTIAKMIRSQGYKTACIGKWGLGMNNSTGNPQEQGFDYFFGYLDQKQAHNYYPTHLWENGKRIALNNQSVLVHQKIPDSTDDDGVFKSFIGSDYAVDRMHDKAMNFIRENKDQPFFLYLPTTIPHLALQAPEDAVKEYVGQFDETPYYGEKGYCPSRYPKSTYAAMITYMDRQVGEIFKLLKDLDLDSNTIVLFTSDNGPTFTGGVDFRFFNSAGGLRGLKMDLYEGGIRVPMIVRWPGRIKRSSTSAHDATHYDVMATMAEILGIPSDTDGLSFLPTLLGKAQKAHDFLYFEYPEKGGQLAVRVHQWKGIKTGMINNPGVPWELYDIKNDPMETNNVSGQFPEVLKKMEAIVTQEHQPSHINEWEFINSKTRKAKP